MVLLKNVSLASYSSYQIGGQADVAFPKTNEELYDLLINNNRIGIPYFIFGFGSNLLFPDTPLKKCMFISLSQLTNLIISDNSLSVTAGFPLSLLAIIAYYLKQKNLYFTYLLPGSIGAATYINAKYFDNSLSDSIISVNFINNPYTKPEFINLLKNQCDFSYKHSIFQSNHGIITDVIINTDFLVSPNYKSNSVIANIIMHSKKNTNSFFSLASFFTYCNSLYKSLISNNDIPNSITEFEKIIKDRTSKKHFDYPSCGSVFKNNYSLGIPTGKLIDEIGLRGHIHGGAQISPHHGNIIINYSNAKADDVKYLISFIQEKIYNKYNFVPECEVQIIE